MAEATDRPAGEPTARLTPAPPPPPPEEPTYRPLSGLAVTGFALAAVYAAVVVGGAVISLFVSHTPLLLPGWTVLLPVTALVLSWAARGRIRDAEGTRTGAALAGWGVGLSFAVGLSYLAYYAATFFAVKSQAADFADGWIRRVRDGQLDRAFLLTVRPPRLAENAPELRSTLENLY